MLIKIRSHNVAVGGAMLQRVAVASILLPATTGRTQHFCAVQCPTTLADTLCALLRIMCGIWLQMVGIWCVLMWQSLGCPSQLRLVELGPGRGTLMADLLRGTAGFRQFAQALQVQTSSRHATLWRLVWFGW
eukprot:GHRR01029137.1.p1 GENE.GHRR01029137.1~~GHRR01029137.1.p1  ORF type:complete len:132 (-),score=25.83 GHRR01029137.1:346-741(-)